MESEIELVERFDKRQPGAASIAGHITGGARRQFGLGQTVKEVEVGPVIGSRLLGQGIEAVQRRDELQVLERGLHALIGVSLSHG